MTDGEWNKELRSTFTTVDIWFSNAAPSIHDAKNEDSESSKSFFLPKEKGEILNPDGQREKIGVLLFSPAGLGFSIHVEYWLAGAAARRNSLTQRKCATLLPRHHEIVIPQWGGVFPTCCRHFPRKKSFDVRKKTDSSRNTWQCFGQCFSQCFT